MSKRAVKSLTLLVLSALSALAIAADPPARVGRVAVANGQVSIGTDIGAEMNQAQVNWPVTSGNMITAAPGARTEVRIGSTSIRLDGDSSLEVLALDDDNIRLRLHYGSASVRVVNPDVLRGFELSTPQGRVHLQQPGRVRIDTERVRDTTAVSVFDGAAEVIGAGSQLTVRAGKRALLTDDDVRTDLARMDDFDNWSAARDRIDDNARSARYVSAEMTGYEDLDRYGSWREDSEYGSLWIPSVGTDWVPYRDGSWTWVEPWGWTWVDNAPWGYAPFHYGRWVYVNRHWAWAPGRRADHLVWAPALVGWVGGAGWNVTFRDHRGPGLGWYPLSPHDRFVPHYRASEDHLRWLNNHVRDDNRGRGQDYRPQGLTVVPQERFHQPGRVNVPRAPLATVPPALVHNAPAGAPPAPNLPARPARGPLLDRDHDGRPDRFEGRPGVDRNGDGRPDRPQLGLIDRNHDGKPDYPQAGMIDRNHDGKPDQLQAGGFDRNRDGRPDRLQAGGIDRNGDGRPDRLETGRVERDGFVRQRGQPGAVQAQAQTPGLVPMPAPAQPQPVVSPTPHQSPQPLSITSPTPHVSPPPQPLTAASPAQVPVPAAPDQGWQRQGRRDWDEARRERGADGDERRERRSGPPPASNAAPAQPAAVMQAPVQQAPVRPPVMMPTPQQTVPEARAERPHREFERPREAFNERPREAAPPPQRVAPPPPAAAPAPAPAAAAARAERQERRESRGDEHKHQDNK